MTFLHGPHTLIGSITEGFNGAGIFIDDGPRDGQGALYSKFWDGLHDDPSFAKLLKSVKPAYRRINFAVIPNTP